MRTSLLTLLLLQLLLLLLLLSTSTITALVLDKQTTILSTSPFTSALLISQSTSQPDTPGATWPSREWFRFNLVAGPIDWMTAELLCSGAAGIRFNATRNNARNFSDIFSAASSASASSSSWSQFIWSPDSASTASSSSSSFGYGGSKLKIALWNIKEAFQTTNDNRDFVCDLSCRNISTTANNKTTFSVTCTYNRCTAGSAGWRDAVGLTCDGFESIRASTKRQLALFKDSAADTARILQVKFTMMPLHFSGTGMRLLPGTTTYLTNPTSPSPAFFRLGYFDANSTTEAQRATTATAICKMRGYAAHTTYFQLDAPSFDVLFNNVTCSENATSFLEHCSFTMQSWHNNNVLNIFNTVPALEIQCVASGSSPRKWSFTTAAELEAAQSPLFDSLPVGTPRNLLLARPPTYSSRTNNNYNASQPLQTVCDDSFTIDSARAICNTMGLPSRYPMTSVTNRQLRGAIGVGLDDVSCPMFDVTDFDTYCSFTQKHNCLSSENVELICPGNLEFETLLPARWAPVHAQSTANLRALLEPTKQAAVGDSQLRSAADEAIPFLRSRAIVRSTRGPVYEICADRIALGSSSSIKPAREYDSKHIIQLCRFLTGGRETTRASWWTVEPLQSIFDRNVSGNFGPMPWRAPETRNVVLDFDCGASSFVETTENCRVNLAYSGSVCRAALAVHCGEFEDNVSRVDLSVQQQASSSSSPGDSVHFWPHLNNESNLLAIEMGAVSRHVARGTASRVVARKLCVDTLHGGINADTATALCKFLGYDVATSFSNGLQSDWPNTPDFSRYQVVRGLNCSASAATFAIPQQDIEGDVTGNGEAALWFRNACNFSLVPSTAAQWSGMGPYQDASTGEQVVPCQPLHLQCGEAQSVTRLPGRLFKTKKVEFGSSSSSSDDDDKEALLRGGTRDGGHDHREVLVHEPQMPAHWFRPLCSMSAQLARSVMIDEFEFGSSSNKLAKPLAAPDNFVAAFYQPADARRSFSPGSGVTMRDDIVGLGKCTYRFRNTLLYDMRSWSASYASARPPSPAESATLVRTLPAVRSVAPAQDADSCRATVGLNARSLATQLAPLAASGSDGGNNNTQCIVAESADVYSGFSFKIARLVVGQRGVAFRIGPDNLLLAAVDQPFMGLHGGEWGLVAPRAGAENPPFDTTTAERICAFMKGGGGGNQQQQSTTTATSSPDDHDPRSRQERVCWSTHLVPATSNYPHGYGVRVDGIHCASGNASSALDCSYRIVGCGAFSDWYCNPPADGTTTAAAPPPPPPGSSSSKYVVKLFCNPDAAILHSLQNSNTPTAVDRLRCNLDFEFSHAAPAHGGVLVATTHPRWGPLSGLVGLDPSTYINPLPATQMICTKTTVAPDSSPSHWLLPLSEALTFVSNISSSKNNNVTVTRALLGNLNCAPGATVPATQCSFDLYPDAATAAAAAPSLKAIALACRTPVLELPDDLSFAAAPIYEQFLNPDRTIGRRVAGVPLPLLRLSIVDNQHHFISAASISSAAADSLCRSLAFTYAAPTSLPYAPAFPINDSWYDNTTSDSRTDAYKIPNTPFLRHADTFDPVIHNLHCVAQSTYSHLDPADGRTILKTTRSMCFYRLASGKTRYGVEHYAFQDLLSLRCLRASLLQAPKGTLIANGRVDVGGAVQIQQTFRDGTRIVHYVCGGMSLVSATNLCSTYLLERYNNDPNLQIPALRARLFIPFLVHLRGEFADYANATSDPIAPSSVTGADRRPLCDEGGAREFCPGPPRGKRYTASNEQCSDALMGVSCSWKTQVKLQLLARRRVGSTPFTCNDGGGACWRETTYELPEDVVFLAPAEDVYTKQREISLPICLLKPAESAIIVIDSKIADAFCPAIDSSSNPDGEYGHISLAVNIADFINTSAALVSSPFIAGVAEDIAEHPGYLDEPALTGYKMMAAVVGDFGPLQCPVAAASGGTGGGGSVTCTNAIAATVISDGCETVLGVKCGVQLKITKVWHSWPVWNAASAGIEADGTSLDFQLIFSDAFNTLRVLPPVNLRPTKSASLEESASGICNEVSPTVRTTAATVAQREKWLSGAAQESATAVCRFLYWGSRAAVVALSTSGDASSSSSSSGSSSSSSSTTSTTDSRIQLSVIPLAVILHAQHEAPTAQEIAQTPALRLSEFNTTLALRGVRRAKSATDFYPRASIPSPAKTCDTDSLRNTRITCGDPVFQVAAIPHSTATTSLSSPFFLGAASFEAAHNEIVLKDQGGSLHTTQKQSVPRLPLLCGDSLEETVLTKAKSLGAGSSTSPSERGIEMLERGVGEICRTTVFSGDPDGSSSLASTTTSSPSPSSSSSASFPPTEIAEGVVFSTDTALRDSLAFSGLGSDRSLRSIETARKQWSKFEYRGQLLLKPVAGNAALKPLEGDAERFGQLQLGVSFIEDHDASNNASFSSSVAATGTVDPATMARARFFLVPRPDKQRQMCKNVIELRCQRRVRQTNSGAAADSGLGAFVTVGLPIIAIVVAVVFLIVFGVFWRRRRERIEREEASGNAMSVGLLADAMTRDATLVSLSRQVDGYDDKNGANGGKKRVGFVEDGFVLDSNKKSGGGGGENGDTNNGDDDDDDALNHSTPVDSLLSRNTNTRSSPHRAIMKASGGGEGAESAATSVAASGEATAAAATTEQDGAAVIRIHDKNAGAAAAAVGTPSSNAASADATPQKKQPRSSSSNKKRHMRYPSELSGHSGHSGGGPMHAMPDLSAIAAAVRVGQQSQQQTPQTSDGSSLPPPPPPPPFPTVSMSPTEKQHGDFGSSDGDEEMDEIVSKVPMPLSDL